MMGAIGTGNIQAGIITMSLGSSGTVYAYADQPLVSPHASVAAFCSSSGGWLPLICTMNLTNATGAVRELFALGARRLQCPGRASADRPPTGSACCHFSTASGSPPCPRRLAACQA